MKNKPFNLYGKLEALAELHGGDTAPYLPREGGTLSGQLLYFNDGTSSVMGDAESIRLYAYKENKEPKTSRALLLYNSEGVSEVSKSLRLFDSGTMHFIFGAHNKPLGTYDGNSSATSRTINTGALSSNFLGIHGNGYGIYVTGNGAIAVKYDDGTVIGIKSSELKYHNGVLTIAGSDAIYNKSGTTYSYQCF